MKITAITVTDEHGTDHRWEGLTGYVETISLRASGESKQAPGKFLGRQVSAHLTLPAEAPSSWAADQRPTVDTTAPLDVPGAPVEALQILGPGCGHHCLVQSPEPGIRHVAHCGCRECHDTGVPSTAVIMRGAST